MDKMTALKTEEMELCERLRCPRQLAAVSDDQVPTLKQLQAWSALVDEVRADKVWHGLYMHYFWTFEWDLCILRHAQPFTFRDYTSASAQAVRE